MRILHILDHSIPEQSGYSFRTLSLLAGQRALGWETLQLTGPKHSDCAVAEEIVDGWHFYRTQETGGLLNNVPGLHEIELMGELSHRIEEVVHRTRPHILHAHSPVLNVLPALRVGRRHGIPVVYEIRAFWEDAAVEHGTTQYESLRYRLSRSLETYAVKRADAVCVICEGLQTELQQRGVAAEKLSVIPNAVDIEKFSTQSSPDEGLAKSLGIDGCVVLGFIGSFYAYEGIDLLLRALPRILQSRPEVRLLLVGGGPEDAALRKQVADAGLQSQVIFTGRVHHDDVKRHYDLVDVLVYPRLPGRLTDLVTPLKPLEAMAQGKLIVASDVGGHRELMRDGVNAVLFEAGNAEHLATKLSALLAMPEQWPAMRQAGRAYVERERTWQRSVANYIPIYERLTHVARRAA